MTLEELIMTNLVNDDTKLCIYMEMSGKKVKRCGNWYQDGILDMANRVIDHMEYRKSGNDYEPGNSIEITLAEDVMKS